jgi:hypothetical protein
MKIILSHFIKLVNLKILNRIAPSIKLFFNLAFIVTFAKIRINDVAYYLTANPYSYSWHVEMFGNNILPYLHYNLSIWGFYALNMYWFAMIINKIYSTLMAKFNSYLLCESLSRYTVIASPLAVVYSYYQNGQLFTIPAIIDAHGLALLSYTSYRFHSFLHNEILTTGEAFDSLSKGSRHIIEDAAALSFQALSTFVASTWYYYDQQPAFIAKCVVFMGIVSGASVYLTNRFVQSMIMRGEQLVFNQPNPNRMKLYIFINAPCVIGVVVNIFLCRHFMNYDISMSWISTQLFCLYMTGLVVALCIFDKMNHPVIHVAFVIHHYFIAQQIAKSGLQQ